jgi:hypothetical protein
MPDETTGFPPDEPAPLPSVQTASFLTGVQGR